MKIRMRLTLWSSARSVAILLDTVQTLHRNSSFERQRPIPLVLISGSKESKHMHNLSSLFSPVKLCISQKLEKTTRDDETVKDNWNQALHGGFDTNTTRWTLKADTNQRRHELKDYSINYVIVQDGLGTSKITWSCQT
jgi:hypothetical protein